MWVEERWWLVFCAEMKMTPVREKAPKIDIRREQLPYLYVHRPKSRTHKFQLLIGWITIVGPHLASSLTNENSWSLDLPPSETGREAAIQREKEKRKKRRKRRKEKR